MYSSEFVLLFVNNKTCYEGAKYILLPVQCALYDCVQRPIQKKHGVTWCMGPSAGIDYYLTFCLLQSRFQHIYHGQPYARVDLNPVPESTLFPSQGLWI